MQHLGRANAVDDLDAGGVFPQRTGRGVQGLAGRHAFAQLRLAQPLALLGHHPVRGRRGEHHRGAKLFDAIDQLHRPSLLQQRHRGANRHREQHLATQAKGKGQRRAADKDIIGRSPQHMAGPAGANRHDIAVEMHRRLGHARGTRGKAQQTSVGRGGLHGAEMRRGLGHQRLQRLRSRQASSVEVAHRLQARVGRLCRLHLGQQGRIAERMADLGNLDDGAQLLGAQQRHGSDRNTAGLDDGKPARHHHRVVGGTQQHAVAGYQAHLGGQYVGNAVGLGLQVGIGPAHSLGLQAEALAPAFGHMAVQQLGGAVEALGELQLGQVKPVLGLQLGRRQMRSGKAVDMRGIGRGRHLANSRLKAETGTGIQVLGRGQGAAGATCLSSSRAMMSCCTSVAPS